MKYKMTEKAKELTKHEFCVNYGVNPKDFTGEEFECNDALVLGGLKKDKMIEEPIKVKPKAGD